MGGAVTLTVPVLQTAVGVRVPTIRLGGTVKRVVAVNNGPWGVCVAVLTTGTTHRPISAVCVLGVVTSVVCCIEHLRVAVLVIRTEEVLRLTARGGAVPVPPAVELVREPSSSLQLTVNGLLWGAAVRGGGGCGGVVTIGIALVTDWSAATVSQILVVTAVVEKVEHFWIAFLIIGTEVVLGF